MNERIQELIPKLGEPSTWGCERSVEPGFAGSRWSGWADHRNPNVGWGPNGCTTPLYDEAQLKKFAELIIKECLGDLKERIALRYQGSDKDRDIGYGMEIVYWDIVDKFGVE